MTTEEWDPPPRIVGLHVGAATAFHLSAYTDSAVHALARLAHERRLEGLTSWLAAQDSRNFNITFSPESGAPRVSNKGDDAFVPLKDVGLSRDSYDAALANVREAFVRGLEMLGFDSASALNEDLERWLRSEVGLGDWISGPQAVSDFGVQRWPAYEAGMADIAHRLRQENELMWSWYRPDLHGDLTLWFYVVGEGRQGSRVSRGRMGHSYSRRVQRSEFKGVATERLEDLTQTHVTQAFDAISHRLDLGTAPRVF